MQTRVLLVSPSQARVYSGAPTRAGLPHSPVLSLATVAAGLLRAGFPVRIFDFNRAKSREADLRRVLREFAPGFVGTTFTTPLWAEAARITALVREEVPEAVLLAGGPHASALPEETLRDSDFSAAVTGEGDFSLAEFLQAGGQPGIPGIACKNGEQIFSSGPRELIPNLDDLPLPAWELFEIQAYRTSYLLARRNPTGWLETSRGCVQACRYCSKSVFGRRFRAKSPERVVEEMARMLRLGFREIHIADDNFCYDSGRVLEICDLIGKRGLDFTWAPVTGVRVDCLDRRLLRAMKEAGCYRIYIGVESGDQDVLNQNQKGIRLEQVRTAVETCRELGLETFGFFMLGLPGETEESLQETIRFARSLDLDLVKATFTIPIPGSELFTELQEEGRLKGRNWPDFNYYQVPSAIYDHPQLDWGTVRKYFGRFYRAFYLNPGYIRKRLASALRNQSFFSDLKMFSRVKWWK